MSMNIEDMLMEFHDSADDSKELLQAILAVVSEGKVPQESEVKKLESSIDSLRRKYHSVYSIVMAQVAEDEMPEEGASVTEYAEAFRNSVAMQRKKQLEEIKRTLESFVSVRSLVNNYTAVLLPFQQQSVGLISRICGDEVKETEDIGEEIVGQRIFLEVLVCEDLDSDEGMNLLDQIGEYYPSRVQYGLAAGKYFIPRTKETVETKEETDAIKPPDSDLAEMEVAAGIDIRQSEEVSSLVRKILDSGLLLDESDHIGFLSKDISLGEDKKVTASIFQSDIRKGNEKALKMILKQICNKNHVTAQSLSIVKGMPSEFARSSLDYLQKKGYLRKYSLQPSGGFYCASPKLMKALTFKDAAKMIGIQRRSLENWGKPIEDKNTSAASRIVSERLYCESAKRLIKEGKICFTENESVFTDSFFSRVFPTDKSVNCEINIGVFWDDTKECDAFVEQIKKTLEEAIPIGCVIFAALDRKRAECLADILLGELGETISFGEIYLYSLSDNCYYTYPGGDVIDVSEIRPEKETVETDEQSDEDLPDRSEKDSAEHEEIMNVQEVMGVELSKRVSPAASGKALVKGDAADGFIENMIYLVNSGKLYAAAAYVKALSLQKSEYTQLYNQLAYAVNDPMGHCNYSTDNVFTLIEKRGEFEDALVMSAAMRTFFSNQVRYDYNIKSYYSGIKEYKMLNDYPALSKVLYLLMEFKNVQQKGMDAYADYHSRSKAELDQEMRKLRREAHTFYDNFVVGRKKENASQKRFLETKRLIFSVNSDFGQYIKAILDGEDDIQPLALEFLQENFYKEDSTIEEDTIDGDKLWEYIMIYWEKAGGLMMYRRHADLMSHLRSNIINTTTKAVQLLARWCDLVNRISDHSEDEGDMAYKRVRKPLMDNLEAAIAEIKAVCGDDTTANRERAGYQVLLYTLKEILDCVNGSYVEDSRKYFYVPFLLTDDVMLDENYMPDLEVHSSTMQSLDPMIRILDHVDKIQKKRTDFEKRLTEILEDKGDDYGEARLIVDYLMAREPSEGLAKRLANIDSGEVYAKETAELRKTDFIGDLELAQSYGQIDNSVEDKKEKILQIVDEWYEWAVETSNFGFFKRVMDGYLAEIKEEAKAREKDLLEQLESFKDTMVPGLSADAKGKRAARIREMINEQNYTVAEDLLARFNVLEEEHEGFIEEDFLREFLDNYDDYYQPVATHRASFANLVSSRTRNKEERGAKRLANNWLPGGSLLGKDRLANLLDCFGFKVESIKSQSSIGKFEHFFVKTAKAKGGQRDNYTHPIAAFGSGAALDGFRVVCINGAYDADGLIDVMKQIGDAKHTLILFDHALLKSERRRLARKSKSALGDKLFGVVDRTVMMFLIRNYDETKMNRMLVSLITPFGYAQPYVWESANVMPPEIFMGRKQELERIKSPTGVNIVYGGRQLGKSALLKKAKEDIDWDENGNRAVLVDVKGLDYKKAAKKIGHALYDEGVLEKDIDTEDWDDLVRVVRRRLQSDKNTIPYLLLLLDEADTFIDSCGGDVNYQPLDALKEIQSIGTGRFKFVIAGLRNIVRFKREALDNNSVLTHLEPMTVRPFNISEARELMETPLYYLGLRFPKEKESLITLILATTNYFPGLIQMYCAKLINAMRNKDYANYDEVDTPIYEVSEEHIKKVLADPEFTQQIREKYIITLKLDEDNYYYLIALLMAFLYHNNGYNEGYSAADIKNAGIELEIAKIADLENIKLESFMEELKELNVLRNTDETHYLFTRFTFFQMMGTRAEVDDKLEEYMGD